MVLRIQHLNLLILIVRGYYDIELTVETELGCEGSFSDEIVIDFYRFLLQFSYSIDTCSNNVLFTNESEFADNYNWSFGLIQVMKIILCRASSR